MALESWVEEMAREELQILEAEHPNRFGYLKLEIKSLISQPKNTLNTHDPVDHGLSVPTQVSCNRKRKVIDGDDHRKGQQKMALDESKSRRGRVDVINGGSRVEMALRRAQACLRRIQLLKQSFLP